MNKNILSLFGFLSLLAIAFGSGYFYRAKNCAVVKIVEPVVQTAPRTVTTVVSNSPTPTEAKTPEVEVVFSNYNSAGVGNQPTKPTSFVLTVKRTIASIQDYHWNSARGKTPGTIGLRDETGKIYGPWEAKGDPGQGGVPNAYWTVFPKIEIPAGSYTIVDSDLASWAQNSGTGGIGMSQVFAVKE